MQILWTSLKYFLYLKEMEGEIQKRSSLFVIDLRMDKSDMVFVSDGLRET